MKSVEFGLGLMAVLVGCSTPDGGTARPMAPALEAESSRALEILNTPHVDGHAVFYDAPSVVDDLRAGIAILEDDEREVWRVSVPRALVSDGATFDLASPDVDMTVRIKDPGCPPRDDGCAMVTLNRQQDDELRVAGSAVVEDVAGVAGIVFQLEAEFTMPNGVVGRTSYRGSGVQP
ncbi:MAG: hypothetical protein KC549_05170 [Myxococcales bacterium]|nr:hypothetical protein [Myxococcales bacterium]MCB9550115.1 hypothetical protein [Myxococcales bacterium]